MARGLRERLQVFFRYPLLHVDDLVFVRRVGDAITRPRPRSSRKTATPFLALAAPTVALAAPTVALTIRGALWPGLRGC